MRQFNFRKTTRRNHFTKIFGGAGRRRSCGKTIIVVPCKRFKMQKIRRAHQGWRNRVFGTIEALNIRIAFGRRKPAKQFRR